MGSKIKAAALLLCAALLTAGCIKSPDGVSSQSSTALSQPAVSSAVSEEESAPPAVQESSAESTVSAAS